MRAAVESTKEGMQTAQTLLNPRTMMLNKQRCRLMHPQQKALYTRISHHAELAITLQDGHESHRPTRRAGHRDVIMPSSYRHRSTVTYAETIITFDGAFSRV